MSKRTLCATKIIRLSHRDDRAANHTREKSGAHAVLISGYRKLTWPCFILHSDYHVYARNAQLAFSLSLPPLIKYVHLARRKRSRTLLRIRRTNSCNRCAYNFFSSRSKRQINFSTCRYAKNSLDTCQCVGLGSITRSVNYFLAISRDIYNEYPINPASIIS